MAEKRENKVIPAKGVRKRAETAATMGISEKKKSIGEKISENPIQKNLYDKRSEFSIVALTGVLGSGFEELTKIMTNKETLFNSVRVPKYLPEPDTSLIQMSEINDANKDENYDAISQLMFNRKYTICYNYAERHYAPYTILKYNNVLWFYTLRYLVNNVANGNKLKDKLSELLDDKYSTYLFKGGEDIFSYYEKLNTEPSSNIIDNINISWDELYAELYSLQNFISEEKIEDDKRKEIATVFIMNNSAFNKFCKAIKEKMLHEDYFLYCMFFWRLGICIRSLGNPMYSMRNLDPNKEKEIVSHNDNIFGVVRLIATIINGLHKNSELHNPEYPGCRICIDSLRNSFEARYLQERFSAFYLVNVYNDNVESAINKNIDKLCVEKEKARRNIIKNATYLLYEKESKSEVSDGHLGMYDVDTCVANAEIHITYRDNPDFSLQARMDEELLDEDIRLKQKLLEPMRFYYLAEQWMKFATLIQRPGLFTPDTDERCMQMAYTAKFNSGCISRQVGAVITNKYGSIRTIGWNDPAYGQIPCSLRDVSDLLTLVPESDAGSNCSKRLLSVMYSEFETGGSYDNDNDNFMQDKTLYKYSKCSFVQYLARKYPEITEWKKSMNGLPLPYCFKQCHTAWVKNESGNPFHQRAIHAEENAMMQMVKYGGEALKGGVIYVTASPCEICSKKLYQIGIRKIVFIDPYPGIARWQVVRSGFRRPELVNYEGAYGASYFKLYSHFIDYKDELQIQGMSIGKTEKDKNQDECKGC